MLEYHVDPTKIRGSGKDGRLTKDDVIAAAEAQKSSSAVRAGPQAPAKAPSAPAQASVQTKAFAAVSERREERVKMSRLRQTIAKRLKDAQNTAAMLTTFNDVDMSAVIDARGRYKDLFEKKHGIRLGFMAFSSRLARCGERRALGQRKPRRRRDRLPRLSRRLGRSFGAQGPCRSGGPQRRSDELRRDRKDDRRLSASGPRKAHLASRICRAAPSPSQTAVYLALFFRHRSSIHPSRRCSECTGSRSDRW